MVRAARPGLLLPLLMSALLLCGGAFGSELLLPGFDPGPLPRRADFSPPLKLQSGAELVLTGTNPGPATRVIVLRLDDGRSTSYADRVNLERLTPPGPFVIRLPTSGLRSSGGRLLDTQDLRRVILFADGDESGPNGPPLLTGIRLDQPPAWPQGSVALDFGPPTGPVAPGFRAVSPGDPVLTGGRPAALWRAGGDALLADGLAGIEQVTLTVPPGRVRVILWTEDLGEWESLPAATERRLRLNGVTVSEHHQTPAEWIAARYVAGRLNEVGAVPNPWESLGAHRGGRIDQIVDAPDGKLVLDLAGSSATSGFLSGLLALPADDPATDKAIAIFSAQQAQHFNERWPVVADQGRAGLSNLAVDPAPIKMAPGTAGKISLALPSGATSLSVEAPTLGDGPGLPLQIFSALRQFHRDGNVLRVDDDRLVPGFVAPLPDLPRRMVFWVTIPADARPGLYQGRAVIGTGKGTITAAFSITVLNVTLPSADRPIGVYLDRPPQFSIMEDGGAAGDAALACDLRRLSGFGLTGVAPPLPPPDGVAGIGALTAGLAAAEAAGFRPPFLAYAAPKRLHAQLQDADATAVALVAAERAALAAGLHPPLWSLADEPANPGMTQTLTTLSPALKLRSQNATRAAQLNHPDDRQFLKYLDVALINPGFGIDAADVAAVRAAGVAPWFYNTGKPRLTAGAWAWRTRAAGYLQWHARMPTADPYDPTDGREDDFSLLLPESQSCPAAQGVGEDLLDLAEGIVDLRWLLWLDQQQGPAADSLRARLNDSLSPAWAIAGQADPVALRAAVMVLVP